MYPSHEHAFYAWLIVIAAVCLMTFIGAMIYRWRFMRTHKVAIRQARARACARAQSLNR